MLVGLALAVLNLFFRPVGTALAVYTFWELLSNESRRGFEPATNRSCRSSWSLERCCDS